MPPQSVSGAGESGATGGRGGPVLEPPAPRSERSPASAVAHLRREVRRVKRHNVERALDRLAAGGEANEAQREAVESLADALVRRVVGGPVGVLEVAARADDRETVTTGVGLFVEDPRDG